MKQAVLGIVGILAGVVASLMSTEGREVLQIALLAGIYAAAVYYVSR